MRRRRAQSMTPSEPLNETLRKAAQEVSAARGLYDKLATPEAPRMDTDVRGLSDEALAEEGAALARSHGASVEALKQWEVYARHLQEAMDATLLLSSLKSEPETKKRRRTTTPEFIIGASVAFRVNNQKPPDDEWIRCEIQRVLQEGAVYEVLDPEPDDDTKEGKVYKANARDLLLIPPPHAAQPALPPGTSVIAQYPETTTFYRAEVVSSKGTKCRLIFYGEEDDHKETEVDRNLVLRPER